MGLKSALSSLKLSALRVLLGDWYGRSRFNVDVAPFGEIGDLLVKELDESFLNAAGKMLLGVDAERSLKVVGDVVLAIEPLFRNEPGRSPNFGKANEKSLPLLLL